MKDKLAQEKSVLIKSQNPVEEVPQIIEQEPTKPIEPISNQI